MKPGTLCTSKIHHAVVTGVDLHDAGSIADAGRFVEWLPDHGAAALADFTS